MNLSAYRISVPRWLLILIITATTDSLGGPLPRAGTVKVWEAATGLETQRFKVGSWVRELTWSPKSDLIIAASNHKGVFVWQVETGKLLQHFVEKEPTPVLCVAVSADGKLLATGESDFNVGGGSTTGVALWNPAFRVSGAEFAVHRACDETRRRPVYRQKCR